MSPGRTSNFMNVTVSDTRQVELPDDEALRIAREVIRQRVRIPERAFLQGEDLCYAYEWPGPDRGTLTERVPTASELDKAAVRVLATLT